MIEDNARTPIGISESENINLKMEAYTIIGDADAIYKQGYEEGFAKGEETGFDEGYADGKEDGLMEGEDIGYNKGYAEGEAFGKENAPTDDLSVTLTSNGTYSYPKPNDKYYADVEVVVNVPSDKMPTQEKSITITKNGSEVISPDAGYVLDKVTVVTNIDTRLPEQEKSLEVTENKVYEVVPDDGYSLSKVTVTGNVASSGGVDDVQLAKITTLSADEWNIAPSTETHFTELFKKIDWTEFNKTARRNFSRFFSGLKSSVLDIENLNTNNANSMSNMFNDSSKLTSLNLSNFNTVYVNNMNRMFYSCYELTSLDLSSFNTSNVTDMGYMFNNDSKLTSLNLSSFNTTEVKNMDQMFHYTYALTDVIWGENWASNKKITTINLAYSPLSKESILDLANKIADKTTISGTFKVSLKSSQKSLFTEDELTALANQFTAKNWTLAWS